MKDYEEINRSGIAEEDDNIGSTEQKENKSLAEEQLDLPEEEGTHRNAEEGQEQQRTSLQGEDEHFEG